MKIKMGRFWSDDLVKFILYKDIKGVRHYARGVSFDFQPIHPGDMMATTFSMPTEDADELLNDLATLLSIQKIKTKDQNLIEGELIATRKHLHDLQVMLKLKKGVSNARV